MKTIKKVCHNISFPYTNFNYLYITAQTSTVDEHFKLIVEDENVLDPELTDIFPNDLPDWYNEKLFKE